MDAAGAAPLRDKAPRCLGPSGWYPTDNMLEPLVDVALDLSADLAGEERLRRLVAVARTLVPCDAIALLEAVLRGGDVEGARVVLASLDL